VWDYVAEVMMDEEALFSEIEQRRTEAQEAHNALITNIAALDALDDKDRRKLDKLLDAYLEEAITKTVYLEKQRKIEANLDDRAAQRADLQTRLTETGILSKDAEKELRALRVIIATALVSANFDEKRKILELLHIRCVWDDQAKELTVSGIFHPEGIVLPLATAHSPR